MKSFFRSSLCFLISILSFALVSEVFALNYEKYFKGAVLHQNTITQVVLNPQDQGFSSLTNVTAWDIGDICDDVLFQIDALSENVSGNITASESFARNSSSGSLNKVCGSISKAETQDGSTSTNMVGHEIDLVTESGSAVSNLTGLLIYSSLNVAPSGTFFGIDIPKPAVGTMMDIRLQNGETISNAVDGQIALSGNLTVPNLALTNPLSVSSGGTGASSLTDGGVLVGSGMGAVTSLPVMTNGQLLIGDGTTDPSIAGLTGTANEVEITNGAGSITIGLPSAVTIGTLTLTNALSAGNGGTGLDTSASSGMPKVSSGTWSIDATQDNLPDGSTYKQFNPASVSITGGSISGISDLAVSDGGTGASDASSARGNLGVAIGSDVEAWDATLDSLANLGSGADKLAYTTGVDSWSESVLTAFGRSLLDDSDAPTARSTLGAEAQDVVLDKIKTKAEVAEGDADQTLSATQLIDDGIFTITPTAARTLTTDTASNIVAGMSSAQVGSNFIITIVDLAAYDVTLAGGTGVTITGQAIANNCSASFRAILTNVTSGSEAVTFYRM